MPLVELDAFGRLLRGELSLAASLEMEPAVVQGLVARAIEHLKANELAEAERLLRGVALAERRAYTPPFLLGSCRVHKGDGAGALEAYDDALARGGLDDPSALAYEIFLGRAQAYLLLGDIARAQEDLRVAATTTDPAIAGAARALLEQVGSTAHDAVIAGAAKALAEQRRKR